MKLVDLLNAANKHYNDGFLSEYYTKRGKFKKNGTGDSLARFIVIEITETFDKDSSSDAQVDEAVRVLENGIEDLNKAIKGLEELRNEGDKEEGDTEASF